jgi:hypothetical protein
MVVYEFVALDMLSTSKYYAGNSFVKRFSAENPIRDHVNVIVTMVDYINQAFKSDKFTLNDECKDALSLLNTIRNVVITTGGTQKDLTQFKELLEVFSIYGIEIYLIERFDLVVDTEPVESDGVKTYLVNIVDDVMPELTRFAGGWGSTYDTPEAVNPGRVVTDYLADTIRFDSQVEDLLKIKSHVEDYKALASAKAESQFDPSYLLKVIESNNYRLLIALS